MFSLSLQHVLLTKIASSTTESIQFDGRAIALGSGTLHVPSSASTSPEHQVEAASESSDHHLNELRASPERSPSRQESTEAPSLSFLSDDNNKQSAADDGEEIKNLTQLLQQSAQQLLKTQADMPPPSPTSAPSPRKRRRKRDDPQSCLTNSEVSVSRERINQHLDCGKWMRHDITMNRRMGMIVIINEISLSLTSLPLIYACLEAHSLAQLKCLLPSNIINEHNILSALLFK